MRLQLVLAVDATDRLDVHFWEAHMIRVWMLVFVVAAWGTCLVSEGYGQRMRRRCCQPCRVVYHSPPCCAYSHATYPQATCCRPSSFCPPMTHQCCPPVVTQLAPAARCAVPPGYCGTFGVCEAEYFDCLYYCWERCGNAKHCTSVCNINYERCVKGIYPYLPRPVCD